MHFENVNEMNNSTTAIHSTHPTTTSTSTRSCASSTDSGVIIIDNKTTFSSNDNDIDTRSNNNHNKNIAKDNVEAETKADTTTRHNNDDDDDEKINYNSTPHNSDKSNHVNIENIINITKQQSPDNNRRQSPQWRKTNNQHTHRPLSKNCSPTVSIRSTTISIVSIDENAIDSSVVDSDSDIEADAEGVHSNYVVTKLGQQTTYTPDSPDLPNINKGLKVISQKINSSAGPLAENILNGGLCPPSVPSGALVSPSTPQIGNIALSNSTDVTFGDKHFYEGPVTIQQFLIDSRDKWKPVNEEDGQDNPIFNNKETCDRDTSSRVNSPPTQSEQPYKFIFNRKAVVITGTIIVLTILIGILFVAVSNYFNKTIHNSKLLGDGDDSRRNIPINSTIVDDNFNSTLLMVERDGWQARPPKGVLDKLDPPVHRVIISHTASDFCESTEVCAKRIQTIQNFHMDSNGWDDIGYNYLIGNDGRVYVGRGWDNMGAHTKGYNRDSLGISFIGTFTTMEPTKKSLNALELLLADGVRRKKLVEDYRLYGHRQMSGTESPGRDNIGGGNVLRIVARDSWLAQPPSKKALQLNLPVSRVIVISTKTEDCTTQAACTFRVRYIQTFNIESLQHDDIIYNFLIGGDGSVYEGRGWDHMGAHLKGYNENSISFAYIGTFRQQKPTAKQLNVTKLLLEEGVSYGKLSKNYRIYSAYDLDPTSIVTSAEALYESFKDWPHWSK